MAGNTLLSLFVRLGIDSAALTTGIKKAGKDAEAVGKKLSGVGKKMTLGLTLPIIGAGVAAVKMASDLEESQNAVNVVFGVSSSILDKFGRTVATTAGLSRAEFNQLGAVTGAFLKNLGFNAAEAAKQTIILTERASDMASIFNTDVSQALNAIQSGLKGEFNPLEQFGVKINAASIEARALSMGLGDLHGKLTDSAKAQAALAMVMEQTNQFAGDFKNTSDGLANSTKILTAKLKDSAAAMGQKLLPYALKLVTVAGDLVTRFDALSSAQKSSTITTLAFVAAIGPSILILGSLVTALGKIIPIAVFVVGAIASIASAIYPVLFIMGILAIAWKQNWLGIRDFTIPIWNYIINELGEVVAAIRGTAAAERALAEAQDTARYASMAHLNAIRNEIAEAASFDRNYRKNVIQPLYATEPAAAAASNSVDIAMRSMKTVGKEAAEAIGGVAIALGEITKQQIAADLMKIFTEQLRSGVIDWNQYEIAVYKVNTEVLGLNPVTAIANTAMARMQKAFEKGLIPVGQMVEYLFAVGRAAYSIPNSITIDIILKADKDLLKTIQDVMGGSNPYAGGGTSGTNLGTWIRAGKGWEKNTVTGMYRQAANQLALGGSFAGWAVVGDAVGRRTGYEELVYAPQGATVFSNTQTQKMLGGGSAPTTQTVEGDTYNVTINDAGAAEVFLEIARQRRADKLNLSMGG